MAKLTEAEREMLAIVTKNPACAWVTSRSNALLSEWAAKGYFLEVDAPAPFLVAYRSPTPAAQHWRRPMGRLTDLELSILSMMDGGPPVPWGAAMSAALEFLVGYGLADQDGTSYFITKAGRRALQAKGGE